MFGSTAKLTGPVRPSVMFSRIDAMWHRENALSIVLTAQRVSMLKIPAGFVKRDHSGIHDERQRTQMQQNFCLIGLTHREPLDLIRNQSGDDGHIIDHRTLRTPERGRLF